MPSRTTAASSRSSSTRGSRIVPPVRRRRSPRRWTVSAEIVRWLIALAMQLVGVTLLIGLTIQGGSLTDWERNTVAPWFGTARWLLPPILVLLGYYLERVQVDNWDWELTLTGSAVGYLSLLGLFGLVDAHPSGGIIGRALAHFLVPLVTAPGAVAILIVFMAAGTLLAVDMSLPAAVAPLGRLVSRAMAALFRPPPEPTAANGAAATARADRPDKAGKAAATADARRFGDDRTPAIPAALPNPGPTSLTFAPPMAGSRENAPVHGPGASPHDGGSVRDGATLRGPHPGLTVTPQSKLGGTAAATPDKPRVEYRLPPLTLLDDAAPRIGESGMDHERNAAIIAAKLASFNIPARVAVWNAGPVVTQYEIEPSPDVKVSRIEALSDDLAMALAARTIRIEAPIPGKSVVGIEIPNKDFNIVALRRILEEVDFQATSKLTFALGRDVAGHARAADLAKMPHLLIAGATGSGKSVMVNALISSLLCKATPTEVRLVLVDLKRVELSAYNGLPHLMVPVITEPERAKAALKWAVAEMETRYRRFAGANARNLAGFNETRADPADRLPYVVLIVDELADLMMREGKNVEEPVVRLAQKARATGIHLVLATQRPSVNVVTGLIKANFPSRIAFAMASQIDSRTILDMPGAEDLIGRGDMLFQPADLPRPIRLQGVFVSDKEIGNICEHWRAEAEPHYDMAIVETDEEPSNASELPDEDADRLLLDAVGVIQEYDRASASLLQRRLKVGYARAARIIDQLEARGYIGPFDGSNARQVLRRDSAPSDPRGGYGEDEV
ncbi:MAG: DNA translocase FtsK 4TM domain-containing protein [Candidatus Limnocylindrales bacterium]